MKLFIIDSFTNALFKGNPAAVVLLDAWLPAEIMQQISQENNLAETAFFLRNNDRFEIRWFTPSYEIDLCGHATLASAHVIFHDLGYSKKTIHFHSHLSGDLKAAREGDLIMLDFPARQPRKVEIPALIKQVTGLCPVEAWKARDLYLIYEHEEQVRNFAADIELLKTVTNALDCLMVVPTAPGSDCDFVSRAFDPHDVIFEDPVTGSTHVSLVPYWAQRLGKPQLNAKQLSKRGGELHCEYAGDRVLIGGASVKYMEGKIFVG